MKIKKRLIIGISGASGAPLAVDILNALIKQNDWESHLIITDAAKYTIEAETGLTCEDLAKLADVCYDIQDIGAPVSSGSFRTEGMIIVPCSMKTIGGLASGYSENLLLRAADVVLKEKRRLVLVTRETPMNAIHLRNLLELARVGAVILPPMLTYYNHPKTVEDMTRHITGKILDQFGLEIEAFCRWGE
jgi:flavin prenyltransferase